MADNYAGLKIEGLDELKKTLAEIPEKLRRRALLNALRAAARVVRDASKAAAPVLQAPTANRASGTVRRAISVRTSKQAKQGGDVGAFVNVRPAKGQNRGAKSPTDPFYWRFLQFGTRKMDARPFLSAGIAALPEALKTFEASLGPQVAKLDKNPKDPL